MIWLLRIILLSVIFCNDGEGPLFTTIIPSADFFEGNSIQIDVQAIDGDGIEKVILYYRFSEDEGYKNSEMEFDINYYSVIPGFEVISDKIEYYFLGNDKFGNQAKYPENGELDPLRIVIQKQFENSSLDDYEINLISPLENSKSEDVSIIILSLYGNNIIDEDLALVYPVIAC